jgi:phosphatidylserine decarboxylase
LPVNERSRHQVQNLYAKNERIVLRAEIAGGEILIVLVAATSVGKVRLVFDSKLTTHNGATQPEHRSYPDPIRLERGAELGRFELGSTVLLLLQPGLCELLEREPNQPVRVGERIGTLLAASPAGQPGPARGTAGERRGTTGA